MGKRTEPLILTTGLMRSGTTWVGNLLGRLTLSDPVQEPWSVRSFDQWNRAPHWPAWVRDAGLRFFQAGLARRFKGSHPSPLPEPLLADLRASHARLVDEAFPTRRVFRFMACRAPEVWDELAEEVRVVYVHRGMEGWLSSVARSPVRLHTGGQPWPLWAISGSQGPWDEMAGDIRPPADIAPLVRAACYHHVLTDHLWVLLNQHCQNVLPVAYEDLVVNRDLWFPRLRCYIRPAVAGEGELWAAWKRDIPTRRTPSWTGSPYTYRDVFRALDLVTDHLVEV